jgi:hypothetical protein
LGNVVSRETPVVGKEDLYFGMFLMSMVPAIL